MIEFDRFPELGREFHAHIEKDVLETAVAVQAGARARARVDTAAMRDGLYVSTGSRDGYQEAEAIVNARRPGHAVGPTRPETTDGLTAVVASTADYTLDWEYGGRYGIQPMLTPSAEEQRGPFVRRMENLL